jgi:hypothetical protein
LLYANGEAMKVSEKKKQATYSAISDSIMDLRIKTQQEGKMIDPLELDADLFRLELKIWKRVKTALTIEGI